MTNPPPTNSPMPDFYSFVPILSMLAMLVSLATAAFTWVRRPGEAAAAGLQAIREQTAQLLAAHRAEVMVLLQAHADRLTAAETHLAHMPTDDELRKLEGVVGQIAERASGLALQLAAVERQLSWIQDFLRTNRG
jgi:hypothetical protein